MQLDLANDGLGAGLGLDMTSGSDGEFQGLGLRCARTSPLPLPLVRLARQRADAVYLAPARSEFLQSLNDPPLYTPDQPPQPQQIGGLPINTDTGLTVPPEHAAGLAADPRDKGKSTGPSVPGSPINKCVSRSPSLPSPARSRTRTDLVRLSQDRALPPHGRRPEGRLPLGPARARHPRQVRGGPAAAVQPRRRLHEAHEVDGRQVRPLLPPSRTASSHRKLTSREKPARSMSASSRQRTLHTLSEFRPTFRVRHTLSPTRRTSSCRI